MLLPLVRARRLSIVGGLLNLPFAKQSLDFLEPLARAVVRACARSIEVGSFATGFALSTLALVIAVVGIVVGHARVPQRAHR